MAHWIWYPGDFEFYLGLRVTSARKEREKQIIPDWKLEMFNCNVMFRSTVDLSADTVVKIQSTGSVCVRIDYKWYSPIDKDNKVALPKGRHILVVNVYNPHQLPSLFIDSHEVITNSSWKVSCDNVHWKSVGCWNFTDAALPPTEYRLPTRLIFPIESESVNGGTLYDFGTETFGYLSLADAVGEGMIILYLGESRSEALDKEHCLTYEKINVNSKIPAEVTAEHSAGFRYVYCEIAECEASFESLQLYYEYLPLENKGGFCCSDTMLNKIYEISLRTLRLTTREFFIDGVKRDRWVWGGDSAQSYLLNFYSFFDNEVCKRTIRFLRGKNPVLNHINTIQSYTMFWFVGLYDYYLYTGDKNFIIEMLPDAKSFMDNFCLKRTDERGFLVTMPADWVFVDWSDITVNGFLSFTQVLFAGALKCLENLCEVAGDSVAAERYDALYTNIVQNIFKTFWNESMGCLIHTDLPKYDHCVTRYSNMFAVIFGLFDRDQQTRVIHSVLLNLNVPSITTPYMKLYELMAFGELGLHKEMHEFVQSYWGGMVNLDCTTFWETYEPEKSGDEHYAMYEGLRYGKSLCHSWGAGPLLIFGKYYLGVSPTAPAYSRFTVKPELNLIENFSGKVPVPDGEIRVAFDNKVLTVENASDGIGTFLQGDLRHEIAGQTKMVYDCKKGVIHSQDLINECSAV